MIDRSLPPVRLSPTVYTQPFIIGGPVAWLILLDDAKNLCQLVIGLNKGMPKQKLDLSIPTLLGQ